MAWRLAKSLDALRKQVNEEFPKRSKVSDGTIGDANHSSRSSDHNPNPSGVVCAIDITHDPNSGCDSYKLAEALLASRDPRIKYVISNKKIAAGAAGPQPWKWRKYTGKNPHAHHVHVSVSGAVDSTKPWNLDAVAGNEPDVSVPPPPPLLRHGSHGKDVETLQALLNKKGTKPALNIDGDFWDKTDKAVRAFQKKSKLPVDGRVGPATWEKLKG